MAIKTSEARVSVEYEPITATALPLLVKPLGSGSQLDMNMVTEWLAADQQVLTEHLYRYGALLFRGFPVASADDFSTFVQRFHGKALDYVGGAVPRTRINAIVFNSTEVTRLRRIRMHNEMAYQRDYPDLIFFYCHQPAEQGGETPIVDCRRIYEDLDPQVRQKFIDKGVKYVRTFQEKRAYRELMKKVLILYRHLTWQGAFKTTSRTEVERLCRERGMEFSWRSDGDLSVSNVFPAVISHPVTGERSWFNQTVVQHFNKKSWGWLEYAFRRAFYRDPSAMPNQAYFGDGSIISDEEMNHVFEVTNKHTVQFPWRAGDILLLDNRLVAHGRNPYRGKRRVYVSMLKQSCEAREPLDHEASGLRAKQVAAA